MDGSSTPIDLLPAGFAGGPSRPAAGWRAILAAVEIPLDRLAYFARMVAEHPGEPRARFSYANELLRIGRDAEAVEQLEAYLALAEDEGNGWGRLAGALATLGRTDEAADAYLRGIDQSIAHGHHGMADELQAALDAL